MGGTSTFCSHTRPAGATSTVTASVAMDVTADESPASLPLATGTTMHDSAVAAKGDIAAKSDVFVGHTDAARDAPATLACTGNPATTATS